MSDRQIYNLSITHPNFAVIMSFQAYNKYIDKMETGSFMIIDSSVMKKNERKRGKAKLGITIFEVPALRMASENMGNPIVANAILIGFLLRKLDIVKLDCVKNVLSTEINVRIRDINMKALEVGWKRASE